MNKRTWNLSLRDIELSNEDIDGEERVVLCNELETVVDK
jgi:hypothetical protein